MITAESQPVFGGVYKLAAIEKDGKIIPKIKVSENTEKITNPGYKKVYRIYDKETRKAQGDVVALSDDVVPEDVPFEIFNPEFVWKRKIISNYEIKELQVPVYKKGELVYDLPSLEEIRDFCAQEIELLWDEIKRFENPHGYYVDLSKRLWALKDRLLNEHGKTVEAAEKKNRS